MGERAGDTGFRWGSLKERWEHNIKTDLKDVEWEAWNIIS
jgi:hypothetical protein